MYEVQVLEDDKDSVYYGQWYPISLEMCTKERHCGCANEEAGLENCSHFFCDTSNLQIAKDKKESLEEEGDTVRIKEVD